MIQAIRPNDDALAQRLEHHADIQLISGNSAENELHFQQGDWKRIITTNTKLSNPENTGLLELIDNNPIVCTDALVIPSAGATLALIALGPLIRAGIIAEDPVLQFSFKPDQENVDFHLKSFGLQKDCIMAYENQDYGSVLALNAMVEIPAMNQYHVLDQLYEEAFGRSFYVHDLGERKWDTELVSGKPEAVFNLRITHDEPNALLTIQVMADKNGKCGSAQFVHALNVMSGFEECLGID